MTTTADVPLAPDDFSPVAIDAGGEAHATLRPPSPPGAGRPDRIVVRRSLGAWATLALAMPFALVGLAGTVAMAAERAPVVVVPLVLLIVFGLPATAILRRGLRMQDGMLVCRTFLGTRRIPLAGLVECAAPQPALGHPLAPRVGMVTLWFADRAHPVTITTYWQREADLARLRAALRGAAAANQRPGRPRRLVDRIEPMAGPALGLAGLALVFVALGVAVVPFAPAATVLAAASAATTAGALWVTWARGSAMLAGDRLHHRDVWGRRRAVRLADIRAVDEQGHIATAHGDLKLDLWLVAPGPAKLFLAALRRRARLV